VGGELGGFFADLMEPHVRARQQQEFIRGAVEQMSRQAGDEIRASSGGFSKIFGQSAYVEGAVTYSVQRRVNEWGANTLAAKDDLKKLPPDELAKYVSNSIEELSSGDPYTDSMVQAAVFEATGPVIQTIAKERHIWEQGNATQNFTSNLGAAADLYQQLGEAAARQTALDEDGGAAFAQATSNFKAAAMKPAGMDDDTYRKSLGIMVKSLSQSGRGHAATALLRSGVLDVLDEADRVKAEDAYDRYGNKAVKQALLSPELTEELTALNAESKLVALGRSVPGGVTGHIQRWRDLNDKLKRVTGFDIDLYDAEDAVAKGMTVLDGVISRENRLEARRWTIEDMATRHQWELDKEARDATEASTAATMAWAMGAPRTGMLSGVSAKELETLANNDYARGDFSGMVRAFVNEKWTSTTVANKLQAHVEGSIGDQYTEATRLAHQQWQQLNQENPAAAMAYYGKWYPQMLNFDRLQTGGMAPSLSFQRAFQNPAQYSTIAMPQQRRKEAGEAIKVAISDMQSGWYNPFGRTNLNEGSQQTVYDAIWADAAVLAQNSSEPMGVLVQRATAVAQANGSLERYGALAWRNKPGTSPLGQMLGLQEDEADKVVTAVIGNRMTKAGFAAGAKGDSYTVQRLRDEKNQPVLYVSAWDEGKAREVAVTIPFTEFQQAATDHVSGKVSAPTAGRIYSGIDPYRRIAGETGAQRLARINREVAAGADPAKSLGR